MHTKSFWAVFIWVNLSEVTRYFLLVRPRVQAELSMVPDIAPVTIPIFLGWMVWDTILIGTIYIVATLYFRRVGDRGVDVFKVACGLWLAIFGLLWLALVNLGLSSIATALFALPLALVELMIAVVLIWRLDPARN